MIDRHSFIQRFTLFARYDHDARLLNRFKEQQKLKKEIPLKPAAVMLLFVERKNSLSVLLTKRAHHLKHHPGQISFPGGKLEPNDSDLIAAAIRETEEEIGLCIPRENILGTLAPLPTISGYVVLPVLGFTTQNYQTKLDANEVELLFELPLHSIIEPAAIKEQILTIRKMSYPIYAIHYQDHLIWGVTAQILLSLKKQLTSY